MKRHSKFDKMNKVAERILDRANGKPCQRQCRKIASEYLWIVDRRYANCLKLQRDCPIGAIANTIGNSVGGSQVSICMKRDSKVTKLLKVAQ